MDKPIVEWRCIVSAPFAENTFVVRLAGTATGVIVDPGFRTRCSAGISASRGHHAPGDSEHPRSQRSHRRQRRHEAGVSRRPADHRRAGDAEKLLDPMKNLSAPFGVDLVSPPADQVVREGDELTYAGLTWECWETPGHSAGHVVFLVPAAGALALAGRATSCSRAVSAAPTFRTAITSN